MSKLAIIGGTGLSQIDGLVKKEQKTLSTPFGEPSADYIIGSFQELDVVFLARHGSPHTIPPHRINYRANIWGLQELGVEQIVAVAAVGGITPDMYPARIVIPEQIIDYTYGREHTFFAEDLNPVTHIDFSHPYSANIRGKLIKLATQVDLNIFPTGVYGATQGPRLETAAEILRMEQDGCNLVGMTGMPEAALARELNIQYANISVVANWAAGKSQGIITLQEIEHNLVQGLADVATLLQSFMADMQ